MSEPYRLHRGERPLLVSVPHAGTELLPDLSGRLTPLARELPDTDWWIDQVWAGAPQLGASMLVANYSRYVIDLNRPPDDEALYAGPGSGLVPTATFDGEPLYLAENALGPEQVPLRLQRYWHPYHRALAAELERLRQIHGFVLLLDAHSIRSHVPRLFQGRLPDLNLGSFDGASASANLVQAAFRQLQGWPDCSSVLDGRFKGGFITRHYGRPAAGVHALQLEMAQQVYMQEFPPERDPGKLEKAQALAEDFMRLLLTWRPMNG